MSRATRMGSTFVVMLTTIQLWDGLSPPSTKIVSSFMWYICCSYFSHVCWIIICQSMRQQTKTNSLLHVFWHFCKIRIIDFIGFNFLCSKTKLLPNCLSTRRETHQIKTVEYLDGCRDLFERGILSHEKIADEHSPVLQNMFNGFSFFVGWADYAWEQGEDCLKIIIRTRTCLKNGVIVVRRWHSW